MMARAITQIMVMVTPAKVKIRLVINQKGMNRKLKPIKINKSKEIKKKRTLRMI
jgi:hypothetical protein